MIHSRDWSDLHANFRSNDHYPCDVIWNGLRMRNVAVRSRGNGSRYEAKPGLELSFDHYASQQRFLGLRALVLDNLVTDPSMIRESTAMALMRRVGVPAPREAPARVFVNGAYAGLYMMVEPVDTVFAQKAFEQPGLLFEYRWTYPFFATFPGESLDPYAVLFESRNLGVHSTAELYTPMRELFRTITDAPDGRLRSGESLPRSDRPRPDAGRVDVHGRMGRRVRLRRHEQLLPVSHRRAGPPDSVGPRSGVSRRGLPAARRRRTERAGPAAAGGSRRCGRPTCRPSPRPMAAAQGDAWLEREFTRQYTLIHDAALADPFKLATNEEFEQAFAELVTFARTRPSFVLDQLAPLR